MQYGVAIKGIGTALPPTEITNDDLKALVETSDEWITSRSGFKKRRLLSGDELVTDMSSVAAQDALDFAGIDAKDVDLIIHACSTPDYIYPAGAALVQRDIGAVNAFGFDMSMACSGIVLAMITASQFIKTGQCKTVIVIGADGNSRYTDWTDRNTCVLFGDGAGAFVMQRQEEGKPCELASLEYMLDGTRGHLLSLRVDMPNCPLVKDRETPADPAANGKIAMNGREVFKFAVDDVLKFIQRSMAKANQTVDDIDFFVFHQANIRIIESMKDRMGIPEEKLVISLADYGNTAAATIPLALKDAVASGQVKPGNRLLFCAFGAGLAACFAIFDWNAVDQRTLKGTVQPALASAE